MIILDTNVLSELMRPKPSLKVTHWLDMQPAAECFTTAITKAEILYGVQLLAKGKRREELLRAAEALFTEDLAGRILSFDSDAALSFARIAVERRALGRPISQLDCQIAAIALIHGASLATHNVSDFDGCGLTVVDPWTE